jgi:hypothetical protein
MQGYDVQLGQRFLKVLADGVDDELVADAVEAVVPEVVAGCEVGVDGVGVDLSGKSGVEGGVEAENGGG